MDDNLQEKKGLQEEATFLLKTTEMSEVKGGTSSSGCNADRKDFAEIPVLTGCDSCNKNRYCSSQT